MTGIEGKFSRSERSQRIALGKNVRKLVNSLGRARGWQTGGGTLTRYVGDWTACIEYEVSRVDNTTNAEFRIKPMEVDVVFCEIWRPEEICRSMPLSKLLRRIASIESCNPVTFAEAPVSRELWDSDKIVDDLLNWGDNILSKFICPNNDWYLREIEQANSTFHELNADQICALIVCGKADEAFNRCNEELRKYAEKLGPKIRPSGGFQYAQHLGGETFIDCTIRYLEAGNQPTSAAN